MSWFLKMCDYMLLSSHLIEFVCITVIKLGKSTSHEAPHTQSSPLFCHFLPLKSKHCQQIRQILCRSRQSLRVPGG
jgi:hypothetical protein